MLVGFSKFNNRSIYEENCRWPRKRQRYCLEKSVFSPAGNGLWRADVYTLEYLQDSEWFVLLTLGYVHGKLVFQLVVSDSGPLLATFRCRRC